MGKITISGASAFIFGTYNDSVDYFKVQLSTSEWVDASSSDRQKSLVATTRWLVRLGLGSDITGLALVPNELDTDIPDNVMFATYELASLLLADPEAASNATTGSNIRKVGAGTAKVEFFKPTKGKILPEIAMQLLAPYLPNNASGLTGNTFSGSTNCDTFSSDNPWGLTRGYP